MPPLETGGPVVQLMVSDSGVRPIRRVGFVRGDPGFHFAHRIVRYYMRGY